MAREKILIGEVARLRTPGEQIEPHAEPLKNV
jgi:hypothetical protein